jgi:hypothetical protein
MDCANRVKSRVARQNAALSAECLCMEAQLLREAAQELRDRATAAFPAEVEVNCGWGDTIIVIVGRRDDAASRGASGSIFSGKGLSEPALCGHV